MSQKKDIDKDLDNIIDSGKKIISKNMYNTMLDIEDELGKEIVFTINNAMLDIMDIIKQSIKNYEKDSKK